MTEGSHVDPSSLTTVKDLGAGAFATGERTRGVCVTPDRLERATQYTSVSSWALFLGPRSIDDCPPFFSNILSLKEWSRQKQVFAHASLEAPT